MTKLATVDAKARAMAQLRAQLAWRGPTGKPQNFVCLDREHALALAGEVETEHDADADMFMLEHALIKVHNELPRKRRALAFKGKWTRAEARTLRRKISLFVGSILRGPIKPTNA